MNYDPSHLVWQMIDQARFIREFGPHILHVHAKDLMIDRDGLYERGILSAGIGWQVPRMPGLGEVDWPGFFSGLYRAGYDGPVIIEHEDRTLRGQRRSGETRFPAGPRRAAPLCEVTAGGPTRAALCNWEERKFPCESSKLHGCCSPARRSSARRCRRWRRTATPSASRTPCRATAGARR